MVRRVQAIALFALAALAFAIPAGAADTYEIDPVHSGVIFRVKHILTMVEGRFDKFVGTIAYDSKAVEDSEVDVTIDAASVTTFNEKRDAHLRSPDFLDAATYPTITFKSTKVHRVDESHLEVDGDLTIRGVTKPTSLTVEIMGFAPGPDKRQRGGFYATARVNRRDFGVSWNKTLDNGGLLVGEEVQIDLPVEAVLQ